MDQALDINEPVILLATGTIVHHCQYLGDGKYEVDNGFVVKRNEIENVDVYRCNRQKQFEPSENAKRMVTLEMEIAEIKKTLVELTKRLDEARRRLEKTDAGESPEKRRKSDVE